MIARRIGTGLLISFLFFSIFSIVSCSDGGRGAFAWAPTDDRNIPEPERSLLSIRSYRIQRSSIYFYDYQTVHWVYRFDGSPISTGQAAAVALYEHNNMPSPVEVDLRQVNVEENDDFSFVRQDYEPLKVGRYLLKIAYEQTILDQIVFEIVPPEGPGSRSNDLTL